MIKTIRLIGTVVIAVMISINFIACDDDDDKDPIDPPVENPNGSGSGNNDDSENYEECPVCYGTGDCQGSRCDNGYCSSCDGKGYRIDHYTGYKLSCDYCTGGKCSSCKGLNKCRKCSGRGYVR